MSQSIKQLAIDYGTFVYQKICDSFKSSATLDPLSTLVKLVMLAFYPPKSKLSFLNNQIYIERPSLLQSFARRVYGSSRNDLYRLQKPLLAVVELYPTSQFPMMIPLYKLAIRGLKILKTSYTEESDRTHTESGSTSGSMASTAINFYITILDNGIRGRILQQTTMMGTIASPTDEDADGEPGGSMEMDSGEDVSMTLEDKTLLQSIYYTDDTQVKFQNIWTKDEMGVIANLVLLLFQSHVAKQQDAVDCYIRAIDNTLASKQVIIDSVQGQIPQDAGTA
jgi:hypothetical protein